MPLWEAFHIVGHKYATVVEGGDESSQSETGC